MGLGGVQLGEMRGELCVGGQSGVQLRDVARGEGGAVVCLYVFINLVAFTRHSLLTRPIRAQYVPNKVGRVT